MEIYRNKYNSENYKEYILPKNGVYNQKSLIYISIDIQKKQLEARPFKGKINLTDWELTNKYSFPSHLLFEIR